MLRLGLTGNLGSGKSTVAALFATHGAHLLASDEIARNLMQPGQRVFDQIAAHFGPRVLTPAGTLDRVALARIAFAEGGDDNLDALNAIVHPAVIARQAEMAESIEARQPHAVLIIESALIFQTKFPNRFEQTLLVTATKAQKIARFVLRQHHEASRSAAEHVALEAEARRRLALQLPDSQTAPLADYVVANDGSFDRLRSAVNHLWPTLAAAAMLPR